MGKFINGMPANTEKEINDAVDAALNGGHFVVISSVDLSSIGKEKSSKANK